MQFKLLLAYFTRPKQTFSPVANLQLSFEFFSSYDFAVIHYDIRSAKWSFPILANCFSVIPFKLLLRCCTDSLMVVELSQRLKVSQLLICFSSNSEVVNIV